MLLVVLGACDEVPRPEAPIARGLADFHNHMFADKAFSGRLFTHDTDPTSACKPPLSADPASFRLAELIRDGLVGESLEQATTQQCFPTPTNLSGQQVDAENLERAWRYGLRLLVVDAVDSEFLCVAAGMQPGCSDLPSIDAQLVAAHALEASIDDASGGPGAGWYRIVTTPSQARQVIADGNLAVVLGVEASNAFGGCAIVSGGSVPPIPEPPLAPSNPNETVWRLNCGSVLGSVIEDGVTTLAVARLEHYRSLGARHFFLIHNLRGIAGGHALFQPLMHGMNNPVQRAPGTLFDRVADMNRVVIAARLPVTSQPCPAHSQFDGGVCNTEGLTYSGLQLARAMATYGSIIDIDHLSIVSKRDLLGPDGLGDAYPLVSSHGGFNEINAGDQNSEAQLSPDEVDTLIRNGGAIAPILNQGLGSTDVATFPPGAPTVPNTCPGTTETWVQAYRYAVSRLSAGRLLHGEPAFVGVGFGSDFNGLAGWPRPRFDDDGTVYGGWTFDELFVGPSLKPTGGYCYLGVGRQFPTASPPHVAYPFTSPLTGEVFERSFVRWSAGRLPYDVSFDGVAHVGMIPDFVEEMRVLGLTDAELEPLWHGAEAFLRTWEATEAWTDTWGTEKARGVQDECQLARSALIDTSGTFQEIITRWETALQETRAFACDYTLDHPPGATTP